MTLAVLVNSVMLAVALVVCIDAYTWGGRRR